MTDILIEKIVNIENLYWAWDKVKSFLTTEEVVYDELEVLSFEARLEKQLSAIREDILRNNYVLSSIKPIAFPKSKGLDDEPQTRQAFAISIRDQVTWMAVINIIGQALDTEMPAWSYSYRLHVPIYYQKADNGKKELKFGWFRASSQKLYRKWKQSWPLYRRHIAITSKILAKPILFKENNVQFKQEELDQYENECLDQNQITHSFLKIGYLDKSYWTDQLSREIYWAGIDLKKFYPNINPCHIINNIIKFYLKGEKNEELIQLISRLLSFKVDYESWDDSELECIDLKANKEFKGIPTGLFVAGFLSNIAMLHIDKQIEHALQENKHVAHFRFVDDHVVLSDSFDILKKWILNYCMLLKGNGLEINYKKTEPENLRYYLWSEWNKENKKNVSYSEAKKSSKLDPDFPTPLMTQTLAKLSNIAEINFSLLDEVEENQIIADLEHLLLTDLPHHELRKDTRVSFASNKLSQFIPRKKFSCDNIVSLEREIVVLEKKIREYEQINSNDNKESLTDLKKQLSQYKRDKDVCLKARVDRERQLVKRTYKLLLKATTDNYQKIRLWARLIEFCRRTGEGDLVSIFDIIENVLEAGECSKLSAEYIRAYILQVFSEQVFVSYKILRRTELTHTTRKKTLRFFSAILSDAFLKNIFIINGKNRNKEYALNAELLFRSSISFLTWAVKNGEIQLNIPEKKIEYYREQYGFFDWTTPYQFISKTKYGIGVWAWWLLRKVTDTEVSYPPNIWYTLVNSIYNRNEQYREEAWAVISLFPRKIPKRLLGSLCSSVEGRKLLKGQGSGWLYEAFDGKEITYANNFKKSVIARSKVIRNKYISLELWNSWTNKYWHEISEKKDCIFDPRLSEWTALELTAKVIKSHLDDNIINSNFRGKTQSPKVHPANYFISTDWIQKWDENYIPTWEEWQDFCGKTKVIMANKNELIEDFRYTPKIEDPYNSSNNGISLVHGVASIFIGLLIRSFELPAYWNVPGTQKIWLYHAKKRVNEYSLSAPTLSIIEACFSKKNRGTMFLKAFLSGQQTLIDDTSYDPPEIFELETLLKYIRSAQDILKRYQLSVQDNQPRQLTPISLIQRTRANTIFNLSDEV